MRKLNEFEIKEDIKIPGTNIVLEVGDKIRVVNEATNLGYKYFADTDIISLDDESLSYDKISTIAKKYGYQIDSFNAAMIKGNCKYSFILSDAKKSFGDIISLPTITCKNGDFNITVGIGIGNVNEKMFEDGLKKQTLGLAAIKELDRVSIVDELNMIQRDLAKHK